MIELFRIVLLVLAGFWILATVLPFVPSSEWWVRMFDFPRAQIAVLAAGTLAAMVVWAAFLGEMGVLDTVVFALLGLSVVYQTARMLPYSRAWPVQVIDCDEDTSPDRHVRFVISNVLMENRERDRWLGVVREASPDVLAAVETDSWWVETARELEDELPHAVEVPQDDTYGMLVRSRFPIRESEVRHYLEDSVPSIHLVLELDSGEPLRLVLLHPRPPRPDIQQDSSFRDAELVKAGEDVAEVEEPTIVAGDLNDVAWSRTTSLFQKLSGLLDPRIGRGLFATFHAHHWWLRYPLDHVFHSEDLALVEIQRLPDVGSDHFPMLIELVVDPDKRPLQEGPEADDEDREEAEEAVQEAHHELATESAEEKQERHEEDQ